MLGDLLIAVDGRALAHRPLFSTRCKCAEGGSIRKRVAARRNSRRGQIETSRPRTSRSGGMTPTLRAV